MKPHCCKDLIIIFNQTFQAQERTVLVSGGEETKAAADYADILGYPRSQFVRLALKKLLNIYN